MVQIGRALGSGRAETSLREHVNELRLKRAFMLLKAEREGHACISDIGLRTCFSDTSHFNRLFRARLAIRQAIRREPLRLYKLSCFAQ